MTINGEQQRDHPKAHTRSLMRALPWAFVVALGIVLAWDLARRVYDKPGTVLDVEVDPNTHAVTLKGDRCLVRRSSSCTDFSLG
jgi:hypothetical protein